MKNKIYKYKYPPRIKGSNTDINFNVEVNNINTLEKVDRIDETMDKEIPNIEIIEDVVRSKEDFEEEDLNK